MARGRRVSRGTSPRRKLVWARTPEGGFANTPPVEWRAANLLEVFNTEYGADIIGCTAMRIRLRLSGFMTSNDDFGAITSVGVRVATDRALAAAAATDPVGPGNDPHADWMFYTTFHLSQTLPTLPTISSSVVDLYYDVKAMRKLDELGQGLYLIADANPAAPWTLTFTSSVLLALP